MNDLGNHIRAYTVLSGILAIGAWGLIWFSYDKGIQAWISLSLCVSYAIWGIIHHSIDGKLYLKAVIDYLVISFIGLIILLTLLYRA
jgi:EamA domain-containing membrane protein RarD